MTSMELYKTLNPSMTETEKYQVFSNGVVSFNVSEFFTKLIKDAARCNSYSSDVVYSLFKINQILSNYQELAVGMEPVWIAFRRHGVDGTEYLLSRIGEYPYNLYNKYFAAYSFYITPAEDGWCNVTINEYWM